MIRALTFVLFTVIPVQVFADVKCKGKIAEIYKWDSFETISILLDSTDRWISMPTKSDEAMALMAFASGKEVTIYWLDDAIVNCTSGWVNNKKLSGWWKIAQ